MIAGITIAVHLALVLAAARGHDHHGHDDQMPLGYARFPFDPIYRGAGGEGTDDISRKYSKLPAYLQISHRRFDLLWYYNGKVSGWFA
jgi:hypothetical protein